MYSNLNINQDPFAKPEDSALAQHEAATVCEPQIARLDYPRLLQLAWAAGIFDGDGCVIISNTLQPGRKNRTYRLTLSLVQNCYCTIEHFRDTLALPNFLAKIRRTKKHNRQVYDLRYDGRHAVAALKLMQPYLVRKSTEGEVALEFWIDGCMGVLPGRNGIPQDIWKTRARFCKKMKKLK